MDQVSELALKIARKTQKAIQRAGLLGRMTKSKEKQLDALIDKCHRRELAAIPDFRLRFLVARALSVQVEGRAVFDAEGEIVVTLDP